MILYSYLPFLTFNCVYYCINHYERLLKNVKPTLFQPNLISISSRSLYVSLNFDKLYGFTILHYYTLW